MWGFRIEGFDTFLSPGALSSSTAGRFALDCDLAGFLLQEGAEDMERLDLKFLALGAAMFIAGISMGIYMGITHDFQLAPVHAHTNLIGFVSLSLFGIVYKLYPQLQQRKLAKVHFYLAAPAALMFPPGIVLAALYQQPLVSIVASLMWFAGAILFLIQLLGLAFGRTAPAATLVPAE
jgi:hypothetical protein